MRAIALSAPSDAELLGLLAGIRRYALVVFFIVLGSGALLLPAHRTSASPRPSAVSR